ncbi:hypothetical protein [Kitasatospora kifunensis]|uniref:Uncharacterized protein n=1 Tax=Kitasatospora kifunensis TaxID=58351 RepID=A0A7W7QYF9_KITKI|nr:hypothetical protein [Kitasatospora kifunensis]MBB4922135.1 hypothetical protein [Kitasatospora kifunensis]
MISVEFELADDLPSDRDIDITEERGHVIFKIASYLEPQEIIDALNEGVAAVLAGGHWFQEWHGEVVSVNYEAKAVRSATRPIRVVHDIRVADSA